MDIKKLKIIKVDITRYSNFKKDLEDLSNIKHKINKIAHSITKLEIRKNIIKEAKA